MSDDTPLPDPNPNRKATLPVVLKGTLTPAIQPPAPGLDYVSILKPLTSYELSDADESALRDVMHGGGSAAASTIKDEAARAFAAKQLPIDLGHRRPPRRAYAQQDNRHNEQAKTDPRHSQIPLSYGYCWRRFPQGTTRSGYPP